MLLRGRRLLKRLLVLRDLVWEWMLHGVERLDRWLERCRALGMVDGTLLGRRLLVGGLLLEGEIEVDVHPLVPALVIKRSRILGDRSLHWLAEHGFALLLDVLGDVGPGWLLQARPRRLRRRLLDGLLGG